jgi:hypothetical protein
MATTGPAINRRVVATWADTLSWRARGRRYAQLVERFPDLPDMRVLDLGGAPYSWQGRDVRPREVVLLNLDWVANRQAAEIGEDAPWMSSVAGDACSPPEDIRRERFDLVFSNSVIEHVGGHRKRQEFAHSARTLGAHYWIQTPNRDFLVEPHRIFPAFQFLPRDWQARIFPRWPLGGGNVRPWTHEQALAFVLDIELLTATQMRFYFPDGELRRERFAGLTKSFIAIR